MRVESNTQLTTAPVEVAAAKNSEPEFGRWQDVQRLFGIRRSTLYALMNTGVVKSVSLRKRGQARGCRLFYLPSIRAYLHSLLS